MEIKDFGTKDGMCIKCHEKLGEDEKRGGIPICANCAAELMDIVHNSITKDGIEEFADDVNDLTDFISSSSRLMGLDDIVLIQVCFNIYMSTVRKMGEDKPSVAKKIFRDATRFIEIEIGRLEDNHNEDNNPFRGSGIDKIFEKMMNSLGGMEKEKKSIKKDDANGDDRGGCSNCDGSNIESGSEKDNECDDLGGGKDDKNEKNEKSDNGKKDGKNSGKRIKID